MKIYANGNFNDIPTPFDQYIGTDIWVKCTLRYNPKWERFCRFVNKRVLDFGVDDRKAQLTYNSLTTEALLNLDEMPKDQIRKVLTEDHTDYADNLILVEPLHTIDSTQLNAALGDASQYETTESIVDRYVGKDIWIKVTPSKSFPRFSYIKICKKDRYYIRFIWIDADLIEDHCMLDPDESVYSLIHQTYSTRAHIDDINIAKPVEILTTEEVEEELEQCPEFDYYGDEDEPEENEE